MLAVQNKNEYRNPAIPSYVLCAGRSTFWAEPSKCRHLGLAKSLGVEPCASPPPWTGTPSPPRVGAGSGGEGPAAEWRWRGGTCVSRVRVRAAGGPGGGGGIERPRHWPGPSGTGAPRVPLSRADPSGHSRRRRRHAVVVTKNARPDVLPPSARDDRRTGRVCAEDAVYSISIPVDYRA